MSGGQRFQTLSVALILMILIAAVAMARHSEAGFFSREPQVAPLQERTGARDVRLVPGEDWRTPVTTSARSRIEKGNRSGEGRNRPGPGGGGFIMQARRLGAPPRCASSSSGFVQIYCFQSVLPPPQKSGLNSKRLCRHRIRDERSRNHVHDCKDDNSGDISPRP